MTKRMLIDTAHAEETRVVVLDGNRLEDFDVETATKRQLKGNIYLAKVVRVEPSLQAAFVEYGGNRHGFLAFSEIHPDYYQIPVADRQRLLQWQAEEARREEEAEEAEEQAALSATTPVPADDPAPRATAALAIAAGPFELPATFEPAAAPGQEPAPLAAAQPARVESASVVDAGEEAAAPAVDEPPASFPAEMAHTDETAAIVGPETPPGGQGIEIVPEPVPASDAEQSNSDTEDESIPESPPPETVGGDADAQEETRERRISPRFLRNYKIQEVIHRRQILLVEVVKEERGTKGAALTTYISLAGRYCVLMPNSPRGGGISRKITSPADRRRLKEVMSELDIPEGMGLIVRTAGANRPKAEIKRDCEYLLRLWDDIREHTLRSVAPSLIYEEANLIKRAIRDVYARDIDEILVDGEEGWKAARDFMRMLMPAHVRKVQLWRESQPLFARQQVESQLDAILSPIVQLRSGGYLVINQTEALVAIDVNSGRSTKERGIEETALRTNLEAAEEVARQLRLRDLAGLIVIDFIDMESRKNNALVERRLKEALKNDRARIQVGHISHFGLMEMSRQRLRPSLAESSFIICPHCGGTGHVRGTESAAIHVLREIEEEGAKRRASEILVRLATPVAMYILNHKRARLREIEAHYAMHITFVGDETLIPPQIRIERVRTPSPDVPVTVKQELPGEMEEVAPAEPDDGAETETEADLEDTEAGEEEAASREGEDGEDAKGPRRRRRRRRRGLRREEATPASTDEMVVPADDDLEETIEGVPEHAELDTEGLSMASGDDTGRGRRRGRRGGRRRRRDGDGGQVQPHSEPGAEQPDLPPLYAGPTPADPFGGQALDIFDMLERAELGIEPAPTPQGPTSTERPPPADTALPPAPAEEMASAFQAITETAQGAPLAEPQGIPAEPSPEPVSPPVPANDVADGPQIKPILVGAEEEPFVEKKRGWWRR
jgi:ribonuclease E